MAALAEIRRDLARLGGQADREIDLFEAALTLAALALPERDRRPYRRRLNGMANLVASTAATGLSAEEIRAALDEVITRRFQLIGDDDDHDPSNLMTLLDSRRGSPLLLGLIWIAAGRRQGWMVEPLAFPRTLLVRLTDAAGRRIVVNPDGGWPLDAAGLCALLKLTCGAEAELEPAYWLALSNREVLLRLQNQVKQRHLRMNRLHHAAGAVEGTLLFAPSEVGLWRELGMIRLRLGDVPGAIHALESFVARAPDSAVRHRASTLLRSLMHRLT